MPRLDERKHVPNEGQRSAFGPGGSITVNLSLQGVDTSSVVRFSIPKVNGFDTPLMPSWEVAALRLFRCSFFSEQGTASTPSSMLIIGLEVGFGRRASAVALRRMRRDRQLRLGRMNSLL